MSEQTIQPRTRQELYDEIRKQGKEEFILSEMKRLGFWDVSTGIPKVSDALVTLKSTLQKELNTLVEKQTIYHNKQQMLKDMRADRMKKALEKRDQTKQRRIAERSQKAKAWAHTQAQNIIYLGQGVSGGLNNQESDQSKLQQLGLPVFESIKALADAMQVSLAELRFLSFARKVSQVSHYRRFSIPKKSGGKRQISAPMPRLKKAQYWILQEILYKLSVHSAAHGFVPQKSILDNARQHTGKAVVINMDLKDFFPTIHYKRVKGLFVSLGYSEQIATVLGLICTEPEIDTVEMDGQTYYVASGERFLPQGAPTSPAITNLICYRMDKRFAGMAAKAGWTYTRYADDLTFSSAKADNINRILWQTRQIIDNEGFNLHPDKLQVMRASSQQEVTGLVVNKFPNVSSEQLKQFRAVLHRIETKGWEQAKFGNGHILQSIRGFANFVNMVNPAKGAPLLQRVDAILANPIAKTTLSNLTTTAIQEKESKIAKQAALKNQQNAKDAASAPVETIKIQEADSNWWDIFV